ncbi:hypothetical protein CYMTET_41874 [Cymbomonas tetramitiformis]|uniref:Nucleotide-sugar transporter n=1 Tax=Cymbomonas tetramitiformis TaxID=36881 RepID=A0AAE0C6B2_9CHLO|nr:hypothetical protein CYMTET_41874 [Cymbomonas tetramitiformis]
MDVADIYTRTLYDASRLYDTNSPQYLAFTVILALTFMSDRQARTVIAFTKPVSEVSKPLLSTTFNPPGANKAALVLAGEVFKVCYSIVSLAVGGQLLANLRGERILRASLPAAIYAFQNWSSQIAYSTLDSVTFNCLNQIKLVSTALCLYLMHGRRQSKEQVIAIGMLVASAFLLQGSPTNHGAGLGNRDPAAYQTGVIASLFSSAASGIAGTLCQQILQGESMSPDELNFTMSTTSVVLLLATLLKDPSNRDVSLGGPAVLFSSWSSTALIPILASAVGGICVGQVSASTST